MTTPPVVHPAAQRVTMRDVQLEAGSLPEVTIAYETFGTLNADRSNAVLIAHALTGDSHVSSAGPRPGLERNAAAPPAGSGAAAAAGPGAGRHTAAPFSGSDATPPAGPGVASPAGPGVAPPAPSVPGWWEELVGPGRAINTDELFVICSNVIGGCTGTTGPSSIAPDGAPYGSRFPRISIRDMARLDLALLDHLGVRRLHSAVGGSMGGARVLELALEAPERVARLCVLAAPAYSTADQIAWAHTQLTAITMDPAYCGGDYRARGTEPRQGLALARQIAHMTYRCASELNSRFGADTVPAANPAPHPSGTAPASGGAASARPAGARQSDAPYYQAESYLDYHGEKLVNRFDAQSYVLLTEALSGHDVRRGRADSLPRALAGYTGPALVLSIDSDRLYPPAQVKELADALPGKVRYAELTSTAGHDGFLTEHAAVGEQLERFFAETTCRCVAA